MAILNVVITDFNAGHMFIELSNQTGMANESWGYQPSGVSLTDTQDYSQNRDSVHSFDISDAQAQNLRDWANQNNSHFPGWSAVPFIGYNCVDFVYDGLTKAGIPATGSDFWPSNNVDEMKEAEERWKHRNDPNYNYNWEQIKDTANTWWESAKDFILRRDPLTLDLDGDGLETTGVAATNPILFDHDGDGIKNGTGWVSADDGFLVRDVNGNGTIDSGRELFGDSTIKSNGQLATDGFDALADLDSIANGGNADGRISSADAQFAILRVWRDLNQDGISQSNELFTLNSLNIASINVTKTANSQTLANGNQIADLGTFTRTDGSTGTAGAVTGNLADINLASDTFHRSFPNELDTTSVATLPDSGAVRDLREAANDSEWSLAV